MNESGLCVNKYEMMYRRILKWFPWIVMAAAYAATMLWMIRYGKPYVDSDMAAEMIYANLLNEEGSLASVNWWFSTDFRVFNVHLLYRVGLLLFPHNWYAARMFAQALWILMLLASYFYLCGKEGLNLRYRGAWGAACLACPFGLFYLWYGYFGGQYTPHMIIVLLSLALVVRLTRGGTKWRQAMRLLFLAVVCLLSGMQGPKGLMIIYVPLLFASAVMVVLRLHQTPNTVPVREFRLCAYSFLALLIAMAGYMVNSKIIANKFTFPSYVRTWDDFHLLSIFEYWGGFLTLLGWQYPYYDWKTEFSILSLKGVLGAFGLLLAGLLLFSVWRLVLHWKELRFEALLAITVFLGLCIVQGAVFAYTTGDGGTNATYWLPALPLVFVIFQLACETEHFHWRYSRGVCAVGFVLCIMGASVSSICTFTEYPHRAVVSLEPVCNWLMENGYTQGYASFWRGDLMTEWTSGEMEVWVATDHGFPDICPWLQVKAHAEPPQGEFFVLSSEDDHYIDWFEDPNVIYQDEDYTVMLFDDYEQMESQLITNPVTTES